MRKKIWMISGVLLIIAIVLMIMPFSTSLIFGPSPDERVVQTYSYFNIMKLISYGQFSPPLTAICTSIWGGLYIVITINRKRTLAAGLKIMAILSIIFSFLSILSSKPTCLFTITIFALMIVSAFMQIRSINFYINDGAF